MLDRLEQIAASLDALRSEVSTAIRESACLAANDVSITRREAMRRLVREVCEDAAVSEPAIYSTNRRRHVARARQAAMWRIRKEMPDLSLPQIGRFFNRDHTTVIHAIRAVEARLKEQQE